MNNGEGCRKVLPNDNKIGRLRAGELGARSAQCGQTRRISLRPQASAAGSRPNKKAAAFTPRPFDSDPALREVSCRDRPRHLTGSRMAPRSELALAWPSYGRVPVRAYGFPSARAPVRAPFSAQTSWQQPSSVRPSSVQPSSVQPWQLSLRPSWRLSSAPPSWLSSQTSWKPSSIGHFCYF